jgi:hypothetical protein
VPSFVHISSRNLTACHNVSKPSAGAFGSDLFSGDGTKWQKLARQMAPRQSTADANGF